ncbi:MAG: hypothetical protein ABIJ48_13390 [Actinomycetota bacterium]
MSRVPVAEASATELELILGEAHEAEAVALTALIGSARERERKL